MSSIFSDKSDQPVEVASSEPTGKEGELWGVDAPSEDWATKYADAATTMNVAGPQTAYAAGNTLFILNSKTGAILQTLSIDATDLGHDGTAFYIAESSSTYFQSRLRWDYTQQWRHSPSWSSAQVTSIARDGGDFGNVIVGDKDGYIGALQDYDATEQWHEQISAGTFVSDVAATANFGVAVLSGANTVAARHTDDGSVLWDTSITEPSHVTVGNGMVVVAHDTSDVKITALDQTDGSQLWQINPSGNLYPIEATDNVVLATFDTGGAAIYDIADGTLLHDFAPFDRTYGGSIDGDTMFFHDGSNYEIARWDRPGSSVSQYEVKKGGSWDPAKH